MCELDAVSPNGTVTVFAGDASDCRVVDGALPTARFGVTSLLASDGAGTVYVLDVGNRVRRVSNGVVETVIELSDEPQGIAVEPTGTVLLSVSSALLRLRP